MNKLIFFAIIALVALCSQARTTASFNWSNPASLTPAFPAPDANNRYGEYISNVDFTNNGVTLTIKDDGVKEQSQRARFLYGYNTQTVEMRAYLNNDIVITAPEGYVITGVQFEGAKIDENYLIPYDEEATFKNGVFTPSQATAEVKFYVAATINCTATYVTYSLDAAVDEITVEESSTPAIYYNLQGVRINRPERGIFIERRSDKSRVIRL